jgi:thioester reductase-like protein
MPATKTAFLTGATGFLGSHLTHRLLDDGNRVTALARASGTSDARARVLDVLARIGGEPLPAEWAGRLTVVDGDLAEERLGLDRSRWEALASSIDEVWHSAASLSFLEEDREDIFRMNVGGTRNILDLAAGTPRRRLHHISTAYVAGKRTGRVAEGELDAGQEFRNPYEESKFRAELLIREGEQQRGVVATVYRPSIVIGESRTGKATHFHGVYAFIRGLWTVARRLRRGQPPDTPVDLPLRILGSEQSTLNFVPVDFVTDALLALSRNGGVPGETFHLTNPGPTPNHLWLGIVCRQLAIRGVRLVAGPSFDETPMTRLETIFHRQMTFYSPYLQSEPAFDSTATASSLAPDAVRCPEVTPEFAARMTGWYIDRLNGKG